MIRCFAAIVMLAASLAAQTTGTATLLGTVTDSQGAIVLNAGVTVRNTNTGFVYQASTNDRGAYYVPYLNPGTYQLRIENAGFKTYVRDGVVLRTNEQPRIDVILELGEVTESITVDSAAPLLETEHAASGQVLEGSTVVKIPVMQKFVHRVLLYMPSTSNINGQHVVGQRQRAIGYTMDGVSGKEPVVGQVGDFRRTMIASLDSIQEFKLWTTGMPAEIGHSAGGLLSSVFRSGTNEFHGAVEDRYTNGKLIHRQYFERLPRTGSFTYHEWGATAGGPIIKDKTFFFGGFQQHYEKVSETFIGSVPSPEMYQGNFDFGGKGFPIYDPATTRLENGKWVRDPFPNNQIPVNRIDPVAAKLIGLQPWKQQTETGVITPSGPDQNLVIPAFGGFDFQRYDAKVDHQFSATHKIFGRYSQVRHRNEGRPIRPLTELVYGRVYVQPSDLRNVVVSDSFTFSPTMINEFRLGFNRRHHTAEPQSYQQDWAGQLGIRNAGSETFPEFRDSAGNRLYDFGPGGRSEEVGEDFSLQENLTKVWGTHTFKGGYEAIHTRYNSQVEAFPSGLYRMGGTDFPFKPNTGNAFAGFLLGEVQRADFTINTANWLPKWWQHAFYFQDNWKAARNLTLELGVRWSYESPFSTRHGQQSQFDPNATDPLTGNKGAIVHTSGLLAKRDWNNFQPRLGLAWGFRPNWVFRSSFGIMTVDLLTNGLNQNFEEYLATAVFQAQPGDPNTTFRLSQGPPDRQFTIQPDGSVPFSGTNFTGRNASWYDPNMRLPYVSNWSAGVQWQFAKSWLVDMTYQGSAGVGLLNNWNINQIPLDISNDPAKLDQIFKAQQNFKPWPHFGNINHYSNYGHNTYHGGTVRTEKRYSQGMTLNAFYTYSKSINNEDDDGTATGADFYNRQLEKARASYDITHRFVGLMTWELPFGKGRKFMNTGGWRNAALGGWDFAATQTYQTGPPVTVTFAGSPYNYLQPQRRPDILVPFDQAVVQDWNIGPDRFPFSAQNRYFNFDAFAYPAPFTVGTLGRNTFEAPGLRWTQLSLSKEFPITERLRFSIRWDVNNPTKEPQYANPNSQFNLANRANFGTFSGNRGSFSDIGTSRMHHIIVGRFVW